MSEGPAVLISGIGIAGPTLAYWLHRYGFVPTLVERAPALRTSGYVIDFWGRGYDIAEQMGLLPAIEREGYHIQAARVVDRQGHRVASMRTTAFAQLSDGRYISIGRSDLARLLFETIAPRCEVIFGDSITGLQEAADGVRVAFERGATRRFDLVIGADGLHSAVRQLAFGPQEQYEHYLGYVVAAFAATGFQPREENVYLTHNLPGRNVGRLTLRDNRTLFLLMLAERFDGKPYPHDLDGQKALLRAAFAGAGWDVPQILAALDGCTDLYFDRVSQIRMEHWTKGRVALIGDAAFCVSLLAGQGSALAMTAAYVLAGELARAQGAYPEAFRRYEALLQPFITRKQRAAERYGAFFVPQSQRGLWLRNLLVNAFRLPGVATLAAGRDLADQLTLPHYEQA